jgi:hypothetical protein
MFVLFKYGRKGFNEWKGNLRYFMIVSLEKDTRIDDCEAVSVLVWHGFCYCMLQESSLVCFWIITSFSGISHSIAPLLTWASEWLQTSPWLSYETLLSSPAESPTLRVCTNSTMKHCLGTTDTCGFLRNSFGSWI